MSNFLNEKKNTFYFSLFFSIAILVIYLSGERTSFFLVINFELLISVSSKVTLPIVPVRPMPAIVKSNISLFLSSDKFNQPWVL